MKAETSTDPILLRAQLLRTVREYFWNSGALEVDTPAIVPASGPEAHIEPFRLNCRNPDGSNEERYLITSPEHEMKKLLARGSGDIFQICKAFRDEECSGHHAWDFTLLEWYRVGGTYETLMEDCEKLMLAISEAVAESHGLDLKDPFPRTTVNDLFMEFAGIDLEDCEESACLLERAVRAGIDGVRDEDDWETLFFRIFLEKVERNLNSDRPVFVTHFPRILGTTAKECPKDSRFLERVELYAGGLELANGWTELTTADEIRTRYREEAERRARNSKTPYPIDEEFFEAIRDGLPECAGMAMGVDRLVMLFAGAKSIGEVRGG